MTSVGTQIEKEQPCRRPRSGGPRTPEGKAISSRNAIRNGLWTSEFRALRRQIWDFRRLSYAHDRHLKKTWSQAKRVVENNAAIDAGAASDVLLFHKQVTRLTDLHRAVDGMKDKLCERVVEIENPLLLAELYKCLQHSVRRTMKHRQLFLKNAELLIELTEQFGLMKNLAM